MSKQKKVFVGLSGGVDSSVAAARLLRDGYDVVGVFIKVWHPEFLPCNWEAERLDAMRVAAKLGIPFLTCDAEKDYEHDVAEYFISEYKAGRTPNPDVMCNKYVKFGAFLRFALENGADYVATGHYARREENDGEVSLWRGKDSNKDQSYFLWTLTNEQLKHVLLPVGDTEKEQIRKEAEEQGLVTAEKKDSQGICFLGHVDIPDFLSHYVELQSGNVLNESGEVIGEHKGALVYTIGQRHGFTINTQSTEQAAQYVIARDIDANTITVSPTPPAKSAGNELRLEDCNFITYAPKIGDVLEVQTRYRQKPTTCEVTAIEEDHIMLRYQAQADSPSEGQSCVLYKGEQCLGGGIIS